MSIDGTDERIPQQGHAIAGNPFSSHKFAGKCELHYKIGIDILAGNVVWVEGPMLLGSTLILPFFAHPSFIGLIRMSVWKLTMGTLVRLRSK